jgi:hypothetical protein
MTGPVQATTLAANTQAGAFFERFDFERVAERQTELGSLELAEYVYAPAGATEARATPGGKPALRRPPNRPSATTSTCRTR